MSLKFKFLVKVAFFGVICSTVSAEELINDSFESGDMLKSNSEGFSWSFSSWVSIVTSTTEVWVNGSTNLSKENAKSFPGMDWTPHSGAHSMRFRFAAGQDISEQRFKLGASHENLWISYWIRVPGNFSHGSQNNKFISLWPENYDRKGTVTWQTRPSGNGSARLVYQDGGVTNTEDGATPFIAVPGDRGRWMHVVLHVKSASSSTANDGVIEFYRRWDNDSTYTKIHEKLNANTWEPNASNQGISQGYLMGWANDAYDSNTEWILDDFVVSDSTLLIASKSPVLNVDVD